MAACVASSCVRLAWWWCRGGARNGGGGGRGPPPLLPRWPPLCWLPLLASGDASMLLLDSCDGEDARPTAWPLSAGEAAAPPLPPFSRIAASRRSRVPCPLACAVVKRRPGYAPPSGALRRRSHERAKWPPVGANTREFGARQQAKSGGKEWERNGEPTFGDIWGHYGHRPIAAALAAPRSGTTSRSSSCSSILQRPWPATPLASSTMSHRGSTQTGTTGSVTHACTGGIRDAVNTQGEHTCRHRPHRP